MTRFLILSAVLAGPALAGDTSPAQLIAGYEAAAGAPADAERGRALFLSTQTGGKPDTPSCTTCHGADVTRAGQTRTGKGDRAARALGHARPLHRQRQGREMARPQLQQRDRPRLHAGREGRSSGLARGPMSGGQTMTLRILALALCLLPAGWTATYADDDGEHGGRRAALVVTDPLTRTECSACHMAYPAALLPARSWTALMADLPNHFGEDASLDEASRGQIESYLVANAADSSGAGRAARTGPDRHAAPDLGAALVQAQACRRSVAAHAGEGPEHVELRRLSYRRRARPVRRRLTGVFDPGSRRRPSRRRGPQRSQGRPKAPSGNPP